VCVCARVCVYLKASATPQSGLPMCVQEGFTAGCASGQRRANQTMGW